MGAGSGSDKLGSEKVPKGRGGGGKRFGSGVMGAVSTEWPPALRRTGMMLGSNSGFDPGPLLGRPGGRAARQALGPGGKAGERAAAEPKRSEPGRYARAG